MTRYAFALAALLASQTFAPAARADDCDPDDGAAEFARCLAQRNLNRLRQTLPAPPRLPSRLGKLCDADDDEDDCPRGGRIPAVRQPLPPMPPSRQKQSATPEPTSTPKARAASAPPDATPGPATAAAASEPPVCTRYLPNLGKTIVIPCTE